MYKSGKKYVLAILVFYALSFLLSTNIAFGKESSIDKSQLDKGIIIVNYIPENNILTKVMISKGNSTYTYTLYSGRRYPLQCGNGSYTVSILENVKATKYRLIDKETIELNMSVETDVYLQSMQIINWNSKMDAIKKADELTKNEKTELDKIKRIYNYIIKNIEYDNEKIKNITSDYIPSIEDIFKSNSGICYDYAVLFAAMLRSVGIPTKLIMGNKSDLTAYHAWNQVYLSDTKEWITIDTTYDSALSKVEKVKMIKESEDYTIKKVY